MNSTRPPEYDLPSPDDVVAGKYRVVSIIGTGGMGVVLGAVDVSLGRKVAIKFLAPHKAARDGATARFAREARAAASIESENVVRVFEVGTLPTGASYIVMEHLVGADLALTLQTRGPLPIAEAVDYVLQACEAIGEAHGRGIVHRDLKPQNLFLTRRPNGSACVKVLDFGISKAIEMVDEPSLTRLDMVMGTPLYMSPEQMRSLKSVDWRSDIWALGAILFELLTASPIFDAATTTELCQMIATAAPIPLRRRRPAAPAALEAAILRCLHKDPNGRYQDVAELADALLPFASERGRISASNVSGVVRAGVQAKGPPRAPLASGTPTSSSPGPASAFDTTSDAYDETKVLVYTRSGGPPSSDTMRSPAGHSSFPPVAAAVPPAGAEPAPQTVPVPTTQRSWQGPPSGKPAPLRRPRAGVAIALGVVVGGAAGLVGIGLMSGGYVVYSKRPSAGAGRRPSASAAATTAPSTRDAPAVTGPKNEELETEKRIAERQCSHMQSLLRSNDTTNNEQARVVKSLTCDHAGGPMGTLCDRASCRAACAILQDQPCLQHLANGEREFPARF